MGIDILIALGVVAFMAMTVPRAVADVVANARASKAGQWDFLDRDRDRRVARGQRWAQAWHGLRQRRHREAGGDGDYRPGAREYFRDLYGGFWQRRIEVAQARRAGRPPYVYDPDAPRWHERFNAAVRDKANRVRGSRGFRLLVDPVGEGSSNSSDDEWLNDPWEPPMPVFICGRCGKGRVRPLSDGNEFCGNCGWKKPPHCQECNVELVHNGQRWVHRQGSRCPQTHFEQTPKTSQPAGDTTTVIHDDDTYILRGAEPQTGHLDRRCYWHPDAPARMFASKAHKPICDVCARDGMPCGWCGTLTNLVHGGANWPICNECANRMTRSGAWPNNKKTCARCGEITDQTHYASMLPICRTCGDLFHEQGQLEPFTSKRQENREGDNTMTETDATGDVYDVETCKQQCQILNDDLTRVDTSLDVIDEAVRSMADTAEKIGAWLASKNANDTSITGMSTVMEALNPDRIKELMDAVAAAKQGVQDTIDSIAPYEEADQLLAGADGSITNGR